MPNVAAVTEEIVKPTVEQMGYELVDVEYIKEFQQWCLNIYIDKEGGVTLNDCEKVSLAVDPLIEAADPTSGEQYFFSVSSPGLDRALKKPRDFERNIGKQVEVRLYKPVDGAKTYIGKLLRLENDNVVIDNGAETAFNMKDIALVKLFVDFN